MLPNISPQQKTAVTLLSIGTFLEFFDLWLYLHMSVKINDLFFPPSFKHSWLLSNFALCSAFLFRPIGAIIFGWIGDTLGRKATILITTSMMAMSCAVIAILPTYEYIGVLAPIILTICRGVQGIASLVEVAGARLYLLESSKPPTQFFLIFLVSASATFGRFAAVGLASLIELLDLSWRIAFMFGVVVAIVGTVARRALKEASNFSNARKRLISYMSDSSKKVLEKSPLLRRPINKSSLLFMTLASMAPNTCLFFLYNYSADFLRSKLGLTPAEVLNHNSILGLGEVLSDFALGYLVLKFHPFRIIITRSVLHLVVIFAAPFVLSNAQSPVSILILQTLAMLFAVDVEPGGVAIFYTKFPILKRFRAVGMSFAMAGAISYTLCAFCMKPLTDRLGLCGMWVILIPVWINFNIAIFYFAKLDKKTRNNEDIM